jgi:hypothetical protein
MCRNIKTLHKFEPPATQQEIHAAAAQFVRKISGYSHPSRVNQAACERATDAIGAVVSELLTTLVTRAEAKGRASESARAAERSRKRFADVAR